MSQGRDDKQHRQFIATMAQEYGPEAGEAVSGYLRASACFDPVEVTRKIALDVQEIPDRTSPDDQPDMCLVTPNELRRIVHDRLMEALQAERVSALSHGAAPAMTGDDAEFGMSDHRCGKMNNGIPCDLPVGTKCPDCAPARSLSDFVHADEATRERIGAGVVAGAIERQNAAVSSIAPLHLSLHGEWTPRRCLHLSEATEIEALCDLLNTLQGHKP